MGRHHTTLGDGSRVTYWDDNKYGGSSPAPPTKDDLIYEAMAETMRSQGKSTISASEATIVAQDKLIRNILDEIKDTSPEVFIKYMDKLKKI